MTTMIACQVFLAVVLFAAVQPGYALPDLQLSRYDKLVPKTRSLRQLFVLFRHGAKVPSPEFLQGVQTEKWTDYPGELTNEGKTALFELGKSIRQRYGRFTAPNGYDAQRYFIGSTAMDRTLMSAQCFNLGLFPPEGSRLWNKRIDWQPIPIYPLDFSMDGSLSNTIAAMMGEMASVCKNFKTVFSEKNQDTMKTLLNYLHGPSNTLNCKNFFDLMNQLDDISTMIWYNMTLPIGLKGRESDFEDLKGAFMNSLFQNNSTIGHSIAGLLLQSFLQRISDYETGKSNYSTVISSEHDANVLAAVTALSDVNLVRSPSFGSNLILEVYNAPDNLPLKPVVKMWYAAAAEEPPRQLTFKANQKDTINLDDFKKFLQNF